jgi:hypothetical protein
MGLVHVLVFKVLDPKGESLPIIMRALRSLGRERTDHEGNLVVGTNAYEYVEDQPDRVASDEEIESGFARGEAFSMIFNRPGEYFAMDSISCLAERENDVSKILLTTREAKYDTYDPGPLFAATMTALSHRFARFTAENSID